MPTATVLSIPSPAWRGRNQRRAWGKPSPWTTRRWLTGWQSESFHRLKRNNLFAIRRNGLGSHCSLATHAASSQTVCPCRYWQTREQRAPTTTKAKPQGKARAEDQEQQDPMEFQSDEENGEEEEAAEEDKGSQGGGSAKRRLQEQRERLHGALALMELANNLSAWAPVPLMPPSNLKPPSCSMCCS